LRSGRHFPNPITLPTVAERARVRRPGSSDQGAIGDDGRAARHGLDHDETERLRPVDRKQQGGGAGKEWLLLCIIDLADELDFLAIHVGLEMFLEVRGLGARYLRGDAQGLPRGARNADRVFRTLLRREASKKRNTILPGTTVGANSRAARVGSWRSNSRPEEAAADAGKSTRSWPSETPG
jgi:hypothetical protein